MKILKCEQCDKTYKDGKFCLNCGQPLKEIITRDINFKEVRTKRSPDMLKRKIRQWLNRIGVQNPDIQIYESRNAAEINYKIDNQDYNFKSHLQKPEKDSSSNNGKHNIIHQKWEEDQKSQRQTSEQQSKAQEA